MVSRLERREKQKSPFEEPIKDQEFIALESRFRGVTRQGVFTLRSSGVVGLAANSFLPVTYSSVNKKLFLGKNATHYHDYHACSGTLVPVDI